MSNSLYEKGREKFLDGQISWTDVGTTIRVVLVDEAHTPDLVNDEFLSDIDSQNRIAVSEPLTGRTARNGVAGADNITITRVSANRLIKYIVIYKDTQDPTTSPLIAHIDTADGLPSGGIQTDTGNIVIEWDTGANKIFKL